MMSDFYLYNAMDAIIFIHIETDSERRDQQEQEGSETLNDYIQDITINSIMNEVDDLDISVFRPNSDMSRSNTYEENTNWANFGARPRSRPRSSPPRTRSRATEDQGPSKI